MRAKRLLRPAAGVGVGRPKIYHTKFKGREELGLIVDLQKGS